MIKPFADDEAAVSIGNLSIENGTAQVVISGSVEITRDAAGLERARALKELADHLVASLEGLEPQQSQPGERIALIDEVENPFA